MKLAEAIHTFIDGELQLPLSFAGKRRLVQELSWEKGLGQEVGSRMHEHRLIGRSHLLLFLTFVAKLRGDI
ncbi:Hypothetical predicted protein [Pelobates cultripes]|uniref:Uncharacterized protein n=1 Tax=Pelobates cultripes TaxID=61616 RepID=A0AAD1SQM2_PELCU|nr:Hypothetical predicted protein [Pelobates cultripes]